jgi:glycosyltransferase involved in cell wall biosynthesis
MTRFSINYVDSEPLISKDFRIEFFQSFLAPQNSTVSNSEANHSRQLNNFRRRISRIKVLYLIFVFIRSRFRFFTSVLRQEKSFQKDFEDLEEKNKSSITRPNRQKNEQAVFLVVPYFLEMNGPESHYGDLLRLLHDYGLKVHYVATESSSLNSWQESSYSKFTNVEFVYPWDLSSLFSAESSIIINCGSPWLYRNARSLRAKNHVLIDYLFNHVGHTRRNIEIRDVLFHTVCQHKALATVLSETDPNSSQYSCIPIPFPRTEWGRQVQPEFTSGPLWVGRLSQEKGVDRLAKIAQIYFEETKEPINVIGSGPLVGLIKQEVLAGSIRYLGKMPHQETLEKIRVAKTVFNTSYIEGVSLVALEALSLGSSVLSFNVGGMSDLLWHPGMSVWKDNNDLQGFSTKLFQLNENQIELTDIRIPISYTKEFQSEHWKKIINLALSSGF